MSRLRMIGVTVAVVGMVLGVPVGAAAMNPDNPFVGAWESRDDLVDPDDGFHDTSQVRLQIGATGNFHLRDEGANGCRRNGFGFVPATLAGTGEFVSETTYVRSGGDLYCYPRDGRGRTLLVTLGPGSFEYLAANDVLINGAGVCWWRSGTGSADDCP